MDTKFYLEVHGCQMNVYDSKRIIDEMVLNGFEQTSDPFDASILIFYTCNIREKAAARLYSNIGRYKSDKTRVIAVGGCVAQAEKEKIFKSNKFVNIVFGPQVYHKLPTYIQKILNGEETHLIDTEFSQVEKFRCLSKRKDISFSEFVTIQEGCDNFCTYCVVPYTRGREYSRPALDIIQETKELIANGAKEITLIGQNVNSYHGEAAYINIGTPKGTWNISRLLQEIAGLEGLKRLRYVTSHPKDFTEDLMEVHKDVPVLVPFTHIPLQSGSDRILKAMNRGHTVREYLDKLGKFRNICPDIQFSSDFIVGFPGETDADFEDTVNAVAEAKYTISYSFKYSPRKNTPAEKMDRQIPEDVKEKRLEILQKKLIEDQIYHNSRLVGKRQDVLFDRPGKKENQYIGKNVYLQSVIVESPENIIGEFRDVSITSFGENSVFGDIA